MSHLKLECARFLLPAAQLEVPGAVITFPPLGLEGSTPSPQGRYANRVRISKRRSGGEGEGERDGGTQGLASPPKRQVSLGHIHSLREAWGRAHRCPFLSSLQPPSRGASTRCYLSSLSRFAWGVRHALPSLGSDRSSGAADPPTHQSYSIPSRL